MVSLAAVVAMSAVLTATVGVAEVYGQQPAIAPRPEPAAAAASAAGPIQVGTETAGRTHTEPSARRDGTRSRGERPSRSEGTRTRLPDWLAQCTAQDSASTHDNGEVPGAELCELPRDHLLHPDAARDWWRMNERYKQRFGVRLCVTDSYRSYEAQQQLFATKPGLAAVPGTSNHGWGVALDLCGGVNSFDSSEHRWLRRHGPAFGWDNPEWARADGSRPEPWHWEYTRVPDGSVKGGRDGRAHVAQ